MRKSQKVPSQDDSSLFLISKRFEIFDVAQKRALNATRKMFTFRNSKFSHSFPFSMRGFCAAF